MRLYYRLQTKCAKVMFSQVSVCPQGWMHGRGGMCGRRCAWPPCHARPPRGVCPGGCLSRECLLRGRCLPGGVSLPGGVCLSSPCGQNDRHMKKHDLAATTLHTVKILRVECLTANKIFCQTWVFVM